MLWPRVAVRFRILPSPDVASPPLAFIITHLQSQSAAHTTSCSEGAESKYSYTRVSGDSTHSSDEGRPGSSDDM